MPGAAAAHLLHDQRVHHVEHVPGYPHRSVLVEEGGAFKAESERRPSVGQEVEPSGQKNSETQRVDTFGHILHTGPTKCELLNKSDLLKYHRGRHSFSLQLGMVGQLLEETVTHMPSLRVMVNPCSG